MNTLNSLRFDIYLWYLFFIPFSNSYYFSSFLSNRINRNLLFQFIVVMGETTSINSAISSNSSLSLASTQVQSPEKPVRPAWLLASFSESTTSGSRRICRICQMHEGDMVRPCDCAGTMGDVHEECLTKWVNMSNKKTCEICKSEYTNSGAQFKPIKQWSKPKCSLNNIFHVLIIVLLGLLISYVMSSVVSDQMDIESSSAFSPAEPVVDGAFVSKHNLSAEAYQGFKECADSLLSGKIAQNEQLPFIQRTLQICENVILNFEDEKQHLMSDVLLVWAMKQQKLSIATLHTQQLHYKELDLINLQFEYFGELLQQTLSGLDYLKQYYPNVGFEEVHSKVRNLTHYFLYYSIIVSRQPPSVIVKCGEAENHRRSRFWFNTEIRILGGSAFGIDTNNENSNKVAKKVALRRDSVATKRYCLCYNIQLQTNCGIELVGKKVSLPFAVLVGPKADVEAKLFLERSFADLVRHPLSDIPTHVSCAEMADALEMKFQAIIETPQKNTDGPSVVQPRKFNMQTKQHLVMRMKPNNQGFLPLDNFMKLPVAEEFQHKKSASAEGDWKLVPFYDWFFKLAEITNKYLYSMWYDGLVYGFCSKEDAENILRCIPRSVLLVRFSDIEYGKIKISVKNRNGGKLSKSSNEFKEVREKRRVPKSIPVISVFLCFRKIFPYFSFKYTFMNRTALNRRRKNLANNPKNIFKYSKNNINLSYSNIVASNILRTFTFINSKSNNFCSENRINSVCFLEIRHHWYEHADLNARSLNSELLSNHKFSDVDLIYPDIDLEVALGGRNKPRIRLPRNLAPDEIYFDNQGAAT
nr:zinc finger protein STAT-B [Caenorhabditis elegans]